MSRSGCRPSLRDQLAAMPARMLLPNGDRTVADLDDVTPRAYRYSKAGLSPRPRPRPRPSLRLSQPTVTASIPVVQRCIPPRLAAPAGLVFQSIVGQPQPEARYLYARAAAALPWFSLSAWSAHPCMWRDELKMQCRRSSLDARTWRCLAKADHRVTHFTSWSMGPAGTWSTRMKSDCVSSRRALPSDRRQAALVPPGNLQDSPVPLASRAIPRKGITAIPQATVSHAPQCLPRDSPSRRASSPRWRPQEQMQLVLSKDVRPVCLMVTPSRTIILHRSAVGTIAGRRAIAKPRSLSTR